MTALAPDRLGLVMALARQLGRRPSSNEVRELLGCGRATANGLLDELDRVAPASAPAGPASAAVSLAPRSYTLSDQGQATGPQVAPQRPGAAPLPTWQTSALHTGHRSGWRRLLPFGPPAQPAAEVARTVASAPPVHRGWLLLLALPAIVAVWGGWVGLGGLAGFGPVHLLPGILDHFTINLAVTLPAGMEAYAVIGLRVWLSSRTRTKRTRSFAAWSTCSALAIGCSGQVAYHVLARPVTGAPMFITVCVACLPVVVLGMGAALFHMVGDDQRDAEHADREAADGAGSVPAALAHSREANGPGCDAA